MNKSVRRLNASILWLRASAPGDQPPAGASHDSDLLAGIADEMVGKLEAPRDPEEGLIRVELAAFVVEEFVARSSRSSGRWRA
jgi:hypothetical protein